MTDSQAVSDVVAKVHREQAGRVIASLARMTGDLDLAEDALHDAIGAALEEWPHRGIPQNPAGWLMTVARRRLIDRLRRAETGRRKHDEWARQLEVEIEAEAVPGSAVPDDRLELFFACCHPALNQDAHVALILKALCGLTTAEIARAFLVPEPTLAQRLVRAKKKIRDAKIPFEVPAAEQLEPRVEAVLAAVYLLFNEGYAATEGDSVTRRDLCSEAISLARLLRELLPDHPETGGLLALMLLHDSRAASRTSSDGGVVVLEDQDRSLWDQAKISEGRAVLLASLAKGRPGAYQLQAAISAVHADAPSFADTDWAEIVSLYSVLVALTGSAVAELNRAVAVAMADGPEAGLVLIEAVSGELHDYAPLEIARAEQLRRLGNAEAAAAAYDAAIELTSNEAERRHLESRRASL